MGICSELCSLCWSFIAARVLSCLTTKTHRIQDILNNLWYRLAIYVLEKFGRWPSYTTGQLNPVPQYITGPVQVSHRENIYETVVWDAPYIRIIRLCNPLGSWNNHSIRSLPFGEVLIINRNQRKFVCTSVCFVQKKFCERACKPLKF